MAQEETSTEAAEVSAEVAAERRAPRRTAAQMIIVGVIASVLGVIAGLLIHWFPPAASTQADQIDTLWDVLIIASVPVFVLVTTVIGFSILNFRMRPGEEGIDGPPIHGNTRIEIIWTAIPATLIVGLVVYAYVVLRDIEKSPALAAGQKERVVRVFGEQFAWSFQYNEGGRRFTTAQLYLPADESVKFDVHSKDVIHDFWVPDFRMKIDAVPGITTHYRVTPKASAIGDHQIVCAELCGLGHAFMRQTAHVLSRPAFDAWVRRASRQGAAGGGGGRRRRPDRRGAGRQDAVRQRQQRGRDRLQLVPHAVRGERDRHDRSEPRPGPQGQGRGVHQAVDRAARRGDRAGLHEGDHAPELREYAQARRARRPREVPVGRDEVMRCPST